MATACARPPHADTVHPGDRSGGTAQLTRATYIIESEDPRENANESKRQDPSFLLFCSRALYMYDTIAPPARSSSPPACHPRARRGFPDARRRPSRDAARAGLGWLSGDQRRYAAADAWATLEAFERLSAAPPRAEPRGRGAAKPAGKRRRNRSASGASKKQKRVEIEIEFA